MTGFTTDLDVRHGTFGDWSTWKLLTDLHYESSAGEIIAPSGFATDGASVPRWLWALLAPTGRWMAPAVIHDLGCTLLNAGTPHTLMPKRKDADRVFQEAMLSVGTNKITAWLMWAAVRIAGMM